MRNNDKKPSLTCKPGEAQRKNLLVCTLDIGAQAGKHVSEPLQLLMKRSYMKERGTLHKVLDMLGLVVITAILAALTWLLIPRSTPDLIIVDAAIAPQEVITGGASTLTFRFENKSREEISDARVTFDFPAHFALDTIETEDAQEIGHKTFELGTIAPGEYGFIHVKGTMFGDVGGEQTFTTDLTYRYGEDNTVDTKSLEHTFSPSTSTLALELRLPEHLVAYQLIEGEIAYKNTGDVRFPDMVITPAWPESFTLTSANPALQQDGSFYVDGIEPGEEGVISFSGRLGTNDDSEFSFNPSFRFGETRYQQEALIDTVAILPTPLIIDHAIEGQSFIPGETTELTITYNNRSDYTLTDVALALESEPAIFTNPVIKHPETIEPGERGVITVPVTVPSYLSRSGLTQYENISLSTSVHASFTFPLNEQDISITTADQPIQTPLTSPINLQSFARYWTGSGEQLGRGPIPPIVGERTTYWVFWNMSGTTNTLKNMSISADLGPGVALTGRQSVSIGTSIEAVNGSVIWQIQHVPATLPTDGPVVGAAFEVAITPTADQAGTVATLLEPAYIQATDQWTDVVIQDGAGRVTTNLTADTKASSYGGVIEE